ncbi:MAG: hypothetical protein A2X86_16115 [Bdellovibrionales bacterium GWA2_49_15]|nr:MAG: hypothetical protein A2X86_16115 [Bdellovibrionales bacterium GWA2_49_15]HAZ13210.1 hypothetical protein [Bdellovibrionales bacterium]
MKFFLMLLLLVSCAQVSTVAPEGHRPQYLSFNPKKGKALLYLYRPNQWNGKAFATDFSINKKYLGKLRSGFFQVELEPGTYTLGAKFIGDFAFQITVKDGDVIFVKGADGWTGYYFEVNPDDKDAMEDIRDLDPYLGTYTAIDQLSKTTNEIVEVETNAAVPSEATIKPHSGNIMENVTENPIADCIKSKLGKVVCGRLPWPASSLCSALVDSKYKCIVN